MFEVREFIASCQAALKEHSPELAVKELMKGIISLPSEVEAALGTPTQGGITTLLRLAWLYIPTTITCGQSSGLRRAGG